MLIGEGIGVPYLQEQASHSTYILMIYRMGSIGLCFFITYIITIIKDRKLKIVSIYSLPLYALLITNFALDIFDFDSFSYILILVFGAYELKEKKNVNKDKKDIF